MSGIHPCVVCFNENVDPNKCIKFYCAEVLYCVCDDYCLKILYINLQSKMEKELQPQSTVTVPIKYVEIESMHEDDLYDELDERQLSTEGDETDWIKRLQTDVWNGMTQIY